LAIQDQVIYLMEIKRMSNRQVRHKEHHSSSGTIRYRMREKVESIGDELLGCLLILLVLSPFVLIVGIIAFFVEFPREIRSSIVGIATGIGALHKFVMRNLARIYLTN
jgi:hypothetical protein